MLSEPPTVWSARLQLMHHINENSAHVCNIFKAFLSKGFSMTWINQVSIYVNQLPEAMVVWHARQTLSYLLRGTVHG